MSFDFDTLEPSTSTVPAPAMAGLDAKMAPGNSPATAAGPAAATTDLSYTDTVAWGVQTEISASDIIEKQRLVKDIVGMQEGLKGLMSRITAVKQDCAKAEADNDMLQMYIDSVTKSLAAKS